MVGCTGSGASDSVCFLSTNSGRIAISSDGGNNWEEKDIPPVIGSKDSIRALSATGGW